MYKFFTIIVSESLLFKFHIFISFSSFGLTEFTLRVRVRDYRSFKSLKYANAFILP